MNRRLIGKSPKFEFGICLFESNRFNIYYLYIIYIMRILFNGKTVAF